jgi:hypothetical protein
VLTPTTPAAEWAALDLSGSAVTSVAISSPPVVNFKLATAQGVPIIGFGSTSKSATRSDCQLPQLRFALAAGTRRRPEQVGQLHRDLGNRQADRDARPPSTDTEHLVDHGDGTYTTRSIVFQDQGAG